MRNIHLINKQSGELTKRPDPNTESQLWNSFKNGESKALEIIFKVHFPYLYDYGIRITRQEELVKDSIQDMFAYLWEKRQNLSNVHSVRTYLIVSLRRTLFKAIEMQNKVTFALQEIGREQAYEMSSFDELLVVEEKSANEKKALKSAVQKIPDRMREALYLKTYQELSYKEIAVIMNVRPQVARNYVSEAYKRLRDLLVSKF